jgi:hypothetical protein
VLVGGSWPIAQPSHSIPSPTLRRRIIKDGAGVEYLENVNGDRGPIRTKVNRDGGVLIYGGGCAIAQLPLRIVTPALQGIVVKDSARVVSARNDSYGGPTRTEVNRDG